ncbi:MAG TPA: PAS domain S-box protein [Rhodoferax sp.]|jgi:two-component system sensor histidine kinase DctS|nr:PAS domain S-box protein [Rhodoferax sp.]HQC86217.1 PAS domain S-box protein [Rhodoferax sp.]
MTVSTAPQPFQPTAPASWINRQLWLLPFLLAVFFVAMIAYWAEANDAQEQSAYQNTLMADIQSVELQLMGRQDIERTKLREVAPKLVGSPSVGDVALQSLPEVAAGMDRLWNRLVWIDADNQVIARAHREVLAQTASTDSLKIQSTGQAEHFVVPVTSIDGKPAGQLLARYEITDLLQSTDLAWLNRRYQVDFVSELGEVIATTESPIKVPRGSRYEKPLASFKDTTLRLTQFEAHASWRTNARTMALLGGLLLLGGAASQLLRREMVRVKRAVMASQTEAAWRQSMEDSALVGLRARDPDGRILYVNKTLCTMVGYSREELVGLIPPLPFWPPEAVDGMMARNMNTLAGESPAEGFETRWRHRDGHILDVMIFEAPLVNSHGVRIGWMGSIVDISERKALEEKERHHVEAMAQHARLNDMGLIASELAHELNQPLTSIASYSAGLEIALKKRLPDESDLLGAVDAVHRNAKKAGDIVNWIRRQSSRSESLRVACNLNVLVAESLKQRKRQIERNRIQMHLNLAPDLPMVTVDRIGVEQVIANLVRNAADALEAQNGVRSIWIDTRLSEDASTRNATVEVLVRDNGPGLQGRTIDMLCSTFYSTKTNGMGLGLGICRAIVESHGGRLSAGDAPTGGAEISFTIPVSQAIQEKEFQ